MKKIMFNDKYGLTRAAIAGTKPMTRRLCKDSATGEVILAKDVDSVRLYPDYIAEFVMTNGDVICSVPRYKVGEVVAIAQSYQDAIDNFNGNKDIAGWGKLIANTQNGCVGYYNKMFVKADLMPHRIRITDLKVERLQDISDEDCMKEGVFQWRDMEDCPKNSSEVMKSRYGFYGVWDAYSTPREAFAALIDKVSGRGTWDRNPWVFAYSYELVK